MGSGGSLAGRRSDGMAEGAQRLSFPGRTAVGAAGKALAGHGRGGQEKMNFGGNDAAIQRNRHALRGL